MNKVSRTITGIIMILLGLGLISIPLFAGASGFFSWIYGIPILLIGIFIFFNKKEDVIERRKDKK